MSRAAAAMSADAAPLAADLRTISVVSLAHGLSHYVHLLLPPLFPAFVREFALSYAELGLLVSVFFVVSGIGQATAGFVVDRFGARPVLYAALACFVVAALLAAAAQGYTGLMAAAALAGLGNAPFHPVDFTILNKRVSTPRLGHAFSMHGISGNLGWAAAPAFLIGMAELWGSWRAGYVGTALLALAVLLLVVRHREALDDRAVERAAAAAAAAGEGTPAGPGGDAQRATGTHPLAFLRSPSLWLCFVFFFSTTVTLSAIQGFAGPALGRMYAMPLAAMASVVTGFMLFGALGMAVGGFLTTRVPRLEATIGVALLAAALLLLLAASGWLGGAAAAFVVALAGFGTGIAAPSRDLLIRSAAPPGATGRVYGTVYSGVDVGFAVGAPIFGHLLDQHAPAGVLAGAALPLVVGVGLAALVAGRVRRAPARA